MSTTTRQISLWKAFQILLFGHYQFSESEEYLEFRYKFLILLMISAALLTLLLIL